MMTSRYFVLMKVGAIMVWVGAFNSSEMFVPLDITGGKLILIFCEIFTHLMLFICISENILNIIITLI